jgi:fructan beta-fructosidase
MPIPSWLVLACLTVSMPQQPANDLLIADFEGTGYGDWQKTGEAFGPGPARGTLPNQMPVSGFLGKGLVNSYFGGDGTTGSLTSTPFTIERAYINLLVGGGNYPGKTNLLIDGRAVRTASGPNDQPGGSEQLDWYSGDVRDLRGKPAVIQIVDEHRGGWGHINVDHIVQSDRKQQAEPAQREIQVTTRYVLLPVTTGAAKRRMRFVVDGKTVREFEIELTGEGTPGFWAFSDVSPFRGKTLRIEVTALPAGSQALVAIRQGNDVPDDIPPYGEKLRPQFHFTSRRGWHNDPNGLVFHAGEYHLFYQHNPYGWNWGNMHWGHAVSGDLVHWQELPTALYPQQFGDWCFSGSGVVDVHDSGGFRTGSEPALVAAYTSTGRGECIVYSNDRGRTWVEYPGNPVVRHSGRDPRLVWHAPTRRWVMAVYDEHEGKRYIAFHTSADLKQWRFESRIEGFYECPDLFELPVQGGADQRRWVLYAADGKYVVGQFDGREFRAEPGKHSLWYGNFYAAQTFSNAPRDRRIQIGWGNGITFPGMPFNQQMTIPCQLTLRSAAEGVRMFAEPVAELAALHGRHDVQENVPLVPGTDIVAGVSGELLHVQAELEPRGAESIGFTIRGVPVVYDAKKGELSCRHVVAPLAADRGRVRLELLVDRGSFEIFGNAGRVAMSVGVPLATDDRSCRLWATGGPAHAVRLDVYEMRSAWK